MRAITYDHGGDASVLRLDDLPMPEPAAGEVRVKVAYSAVNPTDWKNRSTAADGVLTVANQDGSGTVDALGKGVDIFRIGERVWMTLSAYQRPLGGTAQEYVVVPVERVFALPTASSLESGAALGIPSLTAHEALVAGQGVDDQLGPEALDGRTVLVAGGAGAVGNAAIQLARWAGARVIATVSTPAKAALATAAGAALTVDYRAPDAADRIRAFSSRGVDIIVEVAPAANAALNSAVLGYRGTVSSYATEGGGSVALSVGQEMGRNGRHQFVLLYTAGDEAIGRGADSVNDAVSAGALRTGEGAGLPMHVFSIQEAEQAHRAVEAGTTGKVLIAIA